MVTYLSNPPPNNDNKLYIRQYDNILFLSDSMASAYWALDRFQEQYRVVDNIQNIHAGTARGKKSSIVNEEVSLLYLPL